MFVIFTEAGKIVCQLTAACMADLAPFNTVTTGIIMMYGRKPLTEDDVVALQGHTAAVDLLCVPVRVDSKHDAGESGDDARYAVETAFEVDRTPSHRVPSSSLLFFPLHAAPFT